MITIPVKTSRHYDILVGSGLLPQLGFYVRQLFPNAEKATIITDTNVEKLYLTPAEDTLSAAAFNVSSYAFATGEASKNGETYLTSLSHLASVQMTRSDVVIALGGGVVGDMAGFAAATYLRGVPFVQVPTTLLAMVDSSVGGKTGIDLPAGKNLAGAFYQPWLVLCDTDTLHTLPEEVFAGGMAEVIKYGMLGNAQLLADLRSPINDILQSTIATCAAMKRDIVQTDEFDTGNRMLLNLGHTIGHAIERLSGYAISHGRAVAIGMAMITRAAIAKNLCPPEALHILEDLLARYNLPATTTYPAGDIFEASLQDKKRAGAHITEVIPTKPGKCELKKMPVEELLSWIEMGIRQ